MADKHKCFRFSVALPALIFHFRRFKVLLVEEGNPDDESARSYRKLRTTQALEKKRREKQFN